jgi:hypothetical protein
MPGLKLKERRLPSRHYPFVPFPSTHYSTSPKPSCLAALAFNIVWRSFATVAAIGLVSFTVALVRFRQTVAVS